MEANGRRYTNHSIHATTTISILDEAGVDARHIISVSGHKSTGSLRHYSKTSDSIKRKMSDNAEATFTNKENVRRLCAAGVIDDAIFFNPPPPGSAIINPPGSLFDEAAERNVARRTFSFGTARCTTPLRWIWERIFLRCWGLLIDHRQQWLFLQFKLMKNCEHKKLVNFVEDYMNEF